MNKTIYEETIESATIKLIDTTTDYLVTLVDGDINKRLFCLTYGEAIKLYDDTVMFAAKKYNVTPKAIGRPDFTATIQPPAYDTVAGEGAPQYTFDTLPDQQLTLKL